MTDPITVSAGCGEWPAEQMRAFAEGLKAAHDPANQNHNYDRCEHCSYTHHPCDTYELACLVLGLLEILEKEDGNQVHQG